MIVLVIMFIVYLTLAEKGELTYPLPWLKGSKLFQRIVTRKLVLILVSEEIEDSDHPMFDT